jgi:hypothetical protein
MNSDEHEIETQELHYRVTLDFRMLIRPITPEVCQESLFFNAQCAPEEEPIFEENVERLRRLHKLLLNNQKVLEQYLLSVLIQEVGHIADEGLMDAFNAKDEDEILVPLYRSMAEEDVSFFEGCRELKALSENTELITTAFKVQWVGAEIGELNRRMVGDVKRAEIVEQTRMRLIQASARSGRVR